MKTAKYIIVKKHGFECAIIVQPPLNHNEALSTKNLSSDCEILSAGYFAMLPDGEVHVDPTMPSSTLGLHPRKGDSEIIARSLFLMGLLPASSVGGSPSGSRQSSGPALPLQEETPKSSVFEFRTAKAGAADGESAASENSALCAPHSAL